MVRFLLCFLAGAAAFLVPSASYALDPSSRISQYGLTRFSTEQGLPQNHVKAVAQTRDGYLWAGTDDGIVQFDGFRFRTFSRKDTPGLPSSTVECLLADSKEGLWVGTSGGLVRLLDGQVERFSQADRLLDQRITQLALGAEGCVYAGTTAGVLRLCRGKTERLEELRDTMVLSLAAGPQGELFIGTRQKGLWRYWKGRMEQISGPSGSLKGSIASLFVDSSGRLWISPREGGLFRGRCPDLTDLEQVSEGGSLAFEALSESPAGYIWGGTMDGALCRFDGQTKECFTLPLSSKSRSIHSLFTDREGNLWAGTWSDGLFRFRDGIVRTFSSEEGLAGDEFWTVTGDQTGAIWAGSIGGGVSCLHHGGVETYTKAQGLPSENVRSMAPGPDGSVWVGFFDAPLASIRNGAASVYRLPDGRTIGPAWSLMAGRDGSLWFGNRDCGVCRLKDGQLTSLPAIDGFPKVPAYAILEDESGDIWVGTGGEGLVRVRNRELKIFRTEDGLPNGMVMDLHQDASGRIWIATDGGLARYDGQNIRSIGLAEGLPDDVLHSVTEDADAHLWMSTNHGLIRVTKAEVEEVMDGRRKKVEAVVFGTAAGMKSAEGTGSTQPNSFRDRDGDLWFTTTHGVVRARPRTRAGTRPAPPLIVEGLRAYGSGPLFHKVLHSGSSNPRPTVSLPSRPERLEVHYTSLDLQAAEQVTFRYMLEGQDQGWVEVGQRRTAYYTNVRPGSYTFRVRARRIDGAWNETETSIGIEVPPAIYETFWFRTLLVLGTLGGLFVAHRTRVSLHRRREKELERQVKARTENIEQLNAIVKSINETMDFDALLQAILSETRAVRGAEKASALVRLPGSERFQFRGSVGLDLAELRRIELSLEEAEERYIKDSVEISPDVFLIRDTLGRRAEEKVREFGIPMAMLVLRIRLHEAVHGYFVFENARQSDAFDEHDVELLAGLREHIISAFLKARTLKELESALERYRISETALRSAISHAEQASEEAECQRERAESANQAKSTFLANMSHELRTPLNAVLGFAQLLDRDPSLGNPQREFVGAIMRSGDHLLALINDVLSISKIEAGRLVLNEEPFDPRELLRALEEMFRLRASSKGLALSFDVSPSLPSTLHGDAGRLRQVLTNLLGNAVKFTSKGQVRLRAEWSEGMAAFDILDTGPGIPDEEIPHLFQAFVQTDSGRKSKEGTGLGLAISQSFIRLMGGEIRVASKAGLGTTFRFEIPLPQAVDSGVRAAREAVGLAPGESRRRLLVVDDTNESRKLLVTTLSGLGFDVRDAADGEEAVRIWSAWRPDLVWMDIRMPGMDGETATTRIREHETDEQASTGAGSQEFKKTKIIALTASAFDQERDRILASGCDDFLTKPFRLTAICDALEHHLGVRFLYREPVRSESTTVVVPALTVARLATLPSELLSRLSEALELGDPIAARSAAQEIAKIDSPLALEILERIKRIAFDELLDLVERAS